MNILITGGASSGKSSFAETYAASCARQDCVPLVYLALLDPHAGGDTQTRIERHRAQRAQKGFITVEYPYHLERCIFPPSLQKGVVLLEDAGNLCANTMFPPEPDGDKFISESEVISRIQESLSHTAAQCAHFIVVSNIVSGGGDTACTSFIRVLEATTAWWSAVCDEVYELVAGIPVRLR